MRPFWMTAFLDHPDGTFHDAVTFWSAVSGYDPGDCWCGQEEFASLAPPDGDAFVGVQRLGSGAQRVHLDLHVADVLLATAALAEVGAREVVPQAVDRGFRTMTSPGGLVFCLVAHPARNRPEPATWPGGHTSLIDQVCLDISPSAYGEECAFWQAATGVELRHHPPSEFSNLFRPDGQPIRLLLQRLDDEQPTVTAHLDLAATDRAAEVARHLDLGAVVVGEGRVWTVLRDPAGSAYCVTDRDPGTGLLR